MADLRPAAPNCEAPPQSTYHHSDKATSFLMYFQKEESVNLFSEELLFWEALYILMDHNAVIARNISPLSLRNYRQTCSLLFWVFSVQGK